MEREVDGASRKTDSHRALVLAPTLFNIYTNDQPVYQNIRRYIYADDLCIATQSNSLTVIEERQAEEGQRLRGVRGRGKGREYAGQKWTRVFK